MTRNVYLKVHRPLHRGRVGPFFIIDLSLTRSPRRLRGSLLAILLLGISNQVGEPTHEIEAFEKMMCLRFQLCPESCIDESS